jgi:DNA-binding transcriptional LysR family regulator
VDIRQLEHFVAVTEERQFTRAAARCHISQSALSASIRALEREMDVPLFVRTTRNVELTLAGGALLKEAQTILASVASAREAVKAVEGRMGGTLRVGGIQTGPVLDQAALLARFHRAHPDVALHYMAAPSFDLIEQVRAGRLDVGFISVPRDEPRGVEVRALATFPLVLVLRRDHPLAEHEAVELDLLGDEVFVGGPPGSMANAAIDRVLESTRVDRALRIEVNQVSGMLDFVEHGLGVALLPEYVIDDRPALTTVALADPTMRWTVGSVSAPPAKASGPTRALLALVDEAMAERSASTAGR